MTKEITKAIILQKLEDKFGLREFEPATFLFDETVIPTYDVARHFKKLERIEGILSVTEAGPLSYFLVPGTEEWTLHRYSVIFVTGSYTVAGLFVGRPDAAAYTYLDLTAAQNTSYTNDLPKDVFLRSGDRIYVNIDGYTSTGNLTLICEVTKEEVR